MARMSTDGINGDLGPLRDLLATICDLGSAASVLAWDRQTYVPEGGVRGCAQQLASLARVAHEMLISPRPASFWKGPASGSRTPARCCASQGASTTGPSGCRPVWYAGNSPVCDSWLRRRFENLMAAGVILYLSRPPTGSSVRSKLPRAPRAAAPGTGEPLPLRPARCVRHQPLAPSVRCS